MLPTLQEMLDHNLISQDEAVEANAYCKNQLWHFGLMPVPLQRKLYLAWHLLEFDPHQPWVQMH